VEGRPPWCGDADRGNGCVAPVFGIFRLCLFLHEKPGLAQVWWDRDLDDRTLKKAKNEFTGAAIIRAVKKLAAALGAVYEMPTIEQFIWRHPNEKSITVNLTLDATGSAKVIQQSYLQGDTKILEHWIHTGNEIGICILKVFQKLHRERFEKLNVQPRIEALLMKKHEGQTKSAGN
jgi:hypothetical protein